ncbi:MAG: TIR domain-containing protein [Pikeienuella sp.]
MTDAERAYERAKELIAKAKAEGATELALNTEVVSNLTRLPPEIAELTHLTVLSLNNTQVSNLSPLLGLSALEELRVNKTQTADLSPLSGLTALKRLDLDKTMVTDLSPLKGLTELTRLELDRTGVSDLSPLANLRKLERLGLSGAMVEDLRPIRGLVSLFASVKQKTSFVYGLYFRNCTATKLDPELKRLSEIRDAGDRTRDTLAYLNTLQDPEPSKPQPSPTTPYIFLSYAHADATRAATIRTALEAANITVWQDTAIPGGANFRREIMQRLEASAAVLVLWSEGSANSEFVESEAARAHKRSKMIPARIDGIDPDTLPPPFDTQHILDLSQWNGDPTDDNFQRVIESLKNHLLAADSDVVTTSGPDGKYRVEERPLGARTRRDDPDGYEYARRAQSEIAGGLAAQLEEDGPLLNLPPVTPNRVKAYLCLLISNEPVTWEGLDASFGRMHPLLTGEDADSGIADTAAKLKQGHDRLAEYMRKEGSEDLPDREDKAAPEAATEAVGALREAAEVTLSDDMSDKLDRSIGAALTNFADRVADEQDDPAFSDKAVEASERRTGRALRNALGVVASLSAFLGIHAWAVTGPGAAVMAQLKRVIEILISLL